MIAIYLRDNKAPMKVKHGKKRAQILIGTIIQLASYKSILQTFPSTMIVVVVVIFVVNFIINFRLEQKPGHQYRKERIRMVSATCDFQNERQQDRL